MHTGANEIDGVAVAVIRKRCRRINIRIGADGLVVRSEVGRNLA